MESRSIVIGIHGMANKPPLEEKARWWKAAIKEGIQRNLAVPAPEFASEFVYWADLRYEAPLGMPDNLEPYYVEAGMGAFPSPETEAQTEPTLTDQVYRKLDWLQRRTGFTPLDDAILEYRLDDLWGYYEDADFRAAARARLREVIERHAGSRIFLVAHSMGSLIAYDVLRQMEGEAAPPQVYLATLGAPYGLTDIRERIEAEHGALAVPRQVRRWTNFLDRSDIATVGEDLAGNYAPNAAGVRVADVPVINAYRRQNGDRNPHKSYGYLRTPEFSRMVMAFLDEGTGSAEDPAAIVSAGRTEDR